jgi:hypothetical protein
MFFSPDTNSDLRISHCNRISEQSRSVNIVVQIIPGPAVKASTKLDMSGVGTNRFTIYIGRNR